MDIMLTIALSALGICFVILVVGILFVLLKALSQWQYNNQQPIKQVAARVVTKRTEVIGLDTSTDYYCTFEVTDGTRHEFRVAGKEYGQLVEGDTGTLTYQGTRYRTFSRQLNP